MRARNILINICIALASLLLFALLFEQMLVLPAWLKVAGRMHPLVLHFPISLLVLYCGLALFIPQEMAPEGRLHSFSEWILLLTALSATLTALMGLFLSREEGYDADALFWHKWSGLFIAFLTLMAYILRDKIVGSSSFRYGTVGLALAGILLTGHQGAGITHGQNFLFAPMLPEQTKPVVPLADAEVFEHMVKPILEAKCMSCHNAKKAKGELVMETRELLMKGGKDGPLWDLGQPDLGLLMQRVHLPLEEKKHMPPQGKPQLTEEETAVLYQWIRSGASFTAKVAELKESDSLRLLATALFQQQSTSSYDMEPADEETVARLNNGNRVIRALSIGSPALAVNFYNSGLYDAKSLEELSVLKENIVELDLSRMPVTNEQMGIVAQFSHLEKLILNFTPITGPALNNLSSLKHLGLLALAGTGMKKSDLQVLEKFPALERVVVWNTDLAFEELEQLKQSKGRIHYETGFRSDTLVMQLTPPVIQNEEQVLTGTTELKIKNYIKGSEIRYTTDGTDPDSVKSPVYNPPLKIEGNITIKAKAFKKGWISSETVKKYFFRNTYKADSIVFLTPPDPKYTSEGPKSLFDGLKGEPENFANGLWLGYRENIMSTLLSFKKPVPIQQVTLSCLIAMGSYIMPPTSVEVWAGDSPDQLKLAGKVQPVQPTKYEPSLILPVEVKFKKPITARYMKLVALPVAKLPKWHQGKGDKGWVFVDEVFLN